MGLCPSRYSSRRLKRNRWSNAPASDEKITAFDQSPAEGDAVDGRPEPVGTVARCCAVALGACALLVVIIRRAEPLRLDFGDRCAALPRQLGRRASQTPGMRGLVGLPAGQ